MLSFEALSNKIQQLERWDCVYTQLPRDYINNEWRRFRRIHIHLNWILIRASISRYPYVQNCAEKVTVLFLFPSISRCWTLNCFVYRYFRESVLRSIFFRWHFVGDIIYIYIFLQLTQKEAIRHGHTANGRIRKKNKIHINRAPLTNRNEVNLQKKNIFSVLKKTLGLGRPSFENQCLPKSRVFCYFYLTKFRTTNR